MSDSSRGTDRLGRRQAVLDPAAEVRDLAATGLWGDTIGEAADRWEVDRSTIMRLREIAKQGALAALAESRPGVHSKEHDLELVCGACWPTRGCDCGRCPGPVAACASRSPTGSSTSQG
jgi:transposase